MVSETNCKTDGNLYKSEYGVAETETGSRLDGKTMNNLYDYKHQPTLVSNALIIWSDYGDEYLSGGHHICHIIMRDLDLDVIRHVRSYNHVQSPMHGMWTLTECCLARRHRSIDIGITMCVFLLASHVTILSPVSNSSVRTAKRSLFITVIASFCAQRSKRPGTFITLKMAIVHGCSVTLPPWPLCNSPTMAAL